MFLAPNPFQDAKQVSADIRAINRGSTRMGLEFDFGRLKEDAQLLVRLPADVWLMDNHKWALVAWETHRLERLRSQFALMHADFHWDGVDDFANVQDAQTKLLAADLETLRAITTSDKFIRYDSFIAPTFRRRMLSELHFFCLQDYGDEGVDADLCERIGAVQVLHANVESLAAARLTGPTIFDLCLDLLNRADDYDEGDLWTDGEVLTFLGAVRHHICAAQVVTISMSFGYSGTAGDTRHLAELVVSKIHELRQ